MEFDRIEPMSHNLISIKYQIALSNLLMSLKMLYMLRSFIRVTSGVTL
jgi:hypothetical protein